MSIVYSIFSDDDTAQWPLSGAAIRGLSLLQTNGLEHHLQVAGLRPDAELGSSHSVERLDFLRALDQLLPASKKFPQGLQIRARGFCGNKEDIVGSGIGGLSIGGSMFALFCDDEGWRILLMENSVLTPGNPMSSLLNAVHYEPTAFETENMGTVRVEFRKGRAEIYELLLELHSFAESAKGEHLKTKVG